MAYPLPRIALYAGELPLFSRAATLLCSFGAVRVEWRRADHRHAAKTPRKRAASGRLTGFIMRLQEKWRRGEGEESRAEGRLLSYDRGLFLSRPTELTVTA